MQHLGRKSAMNNGKFGTWTSECFVVLITEWEMISPWSLILWLTLHICSSALVCLQQKTIEKKMINSSLIGFFPLWWEQSGWPQRLNVLIGGESLPVFILSVTGTRQPRCFRSLHNQGWLVLACTLYSYGISVLAADPHLPARLWSLKTFLLWLFFWLASSPAAGSGVPDSFLCQASLGHSCDETVVLLAHTGTRTWQHHPHNQGLSSRLSVCPSVHHLCKLDLMNVGELRWKTTPSCWCPLWFGLFIAFILDR